MRILAAGCFVAVRSSPGSSSLQYHCAVRLPSDAYRLADSSLCGLKWFSVLFQHRQSLPVLHCDLPLCAFAEIHGRVDLAREQASCDFCRDADLLRPDEHPHALAWFYSIG